MQCDVDVIGSESLLCEVEMLLIIDEVFRAFGLTDYRIYINHRVFLSTIAGKIGVSSDRENDFFYNTGQIRQDRCSRRSG